MTDDQAVVIQEVEEAMIMAGIENNLFHVRTLTPIYPILVKNFTEPDHYKTHKTRSCMVKF